MNVLFVRSGNNGIDPVSSNQGESLRNININVYYFDIIGKGILGYLKNITKLRNFYNEIKPDIIHSHYSLSGYIMALIKHNKPVVCSLMGTDIYKSNALTRSILKYFIKHKWEATIIKSVKMAEFLPGCKPEVIPNGVNFEKFIVVDKYEAKSRLKWNDDCFNILFSAGSDRKVKNFELADKALKIIDKKIKNIKIHFLTGINSDKMYLYYNAADLLLLTSLYEGSPNVIKEAMACNCPIVATNVGDIEDVIGKTEGCFLTTFDPYEVAEKIEKAIIFGKRTNGREKIKHLDSQIIAEKITNIYNKIINRN